MDVIKSKDDLTVTPVQQPITRKDGRWTAKRCGSYMVQLLGALFLD